MPSYPQLAPLPTLPELAPLPELGGRRKKRRRPAYNLSLEEEESLLSELGSNALSGLGTIAHTLGKPGAAVRGTISGLTGGEWGGGLLNLIPFSNTMGITDPEDWVYSRDIMRRMGLMGKKDTWGNFGAGLAADIVTDPLSWTSFGAGGAASKAGQLLHKAGLAEFLPDVLQATAKGSKALGPRVGGMTTTLKEALENLPGPVRKAAPGKIKTAGEAMGVNAADLMDTPLRGLMGIHAPLMPSKQIATVGSQAGPVAKAIGGALDYIGGNIRYSGPVRALYAGFAPSVQGTLPEAAQRASAAASRLHTFKSAASRETIGGYLTRLSEAGALKTGDEGIQDAMAMRAFMEEGKALPAHLQGRGVEPILDALNKFSRDQLAGEQALGMATKDLNDTFNYVSRYAHRFGVGKQQAKAFRALSPTHPSQIQRMEFFRGVPSTVIDKMSIDPAISGTLSRAKPTGWQSRWGNTGGVDLEAAVEHIKATYPAVKDVADDDIIRQARWLSELDPQHAEAGIPVFPHHPIFDVLKRDEFSKRAMTNADVSYDLLSREARHYSEILPGESPANSSLLQVLKDAGLTGDAAHDVMASRLSPEALGKFSDKLALEVVLRDLSVPQEIADAVVGMNKGFSSPKWMETFVKQFDNFTNFFKAHVTSYFPAFVNRNLVSGQVQNALAGVYGPGAVNMYRAMRDAQILLRGKGVIPGVMNIPIIKAMPEITNPQEATRKIAELAFAHKLGGRLQMEAAQHVGGVAASSPTEVLGLLPGLQPWSTAQAAKKLIPGRNPGWWNPLRVRGIGQTTESQFFLSQAGEEANYWVESMNRLGPFVSMLREGADPSQAARRIKLLQVDYTATASGDVAMRRMIPFFAFLKGQAHFLAKELTQHPGGALSQAIQAESKGHEQLPAFTPPYVQTSAALPGEMLPEAVFGEPAPDTVRTMTGLGLMHEDPLQFLAMDPQKPLTSLPMNMLREGMGRLNPLLQRPIEAATGVSLFKSGPRGGRQLEDMDPPLARLISNIMGMKRPPQLPWGVETVAQLTAPRVTTTLKTATEDPERKNVATKMLNLLTGARVTDISPRARESQMREATEDLMGDLGGRVFEVRWIPEDVRAKMSEKELAEAEKLEVLSKILGERAKRRAKREEELKPIPDLY
ncbi:MAG: hypothetical protein ACYTFQ_17670 [Planctomycetota bacterium]|jgi:hypothetical protein